MRRFPQAPVAVGASVALGAVLVAVLSDDPGRALYYFFLGPFLSAYAFGNMLNVMGLLMLTGLGSSVAFNSGTFNLGGEGQAYAGSLAGVLVCLALPGMGIVGLPLSMASAALVGGLVALVSGLLRRHVDELISTYLLSSSLFPLLDYLVAFPLKDPDYNLLATRAADESYALPRLLEPSFLNSGFLVSVLLAAAAYLFLKKTRAGFQLRMTGLNRNAARAAGMATGAVTVSSLAASGMLHGLAGAFASLGTYRRCIVGVASGLGWNGIGVALVARNRPALVPLAAFIFAYLDSAAKSTSLFTESGSAMIGMLQAVILLFVTVKRWRR